MLLLQLSIEERAELMHEFGWGRRRVIFGARTHQQTIHKNCVMVGIFRLHQREEDRRLISPANVSLPIAPI